MAHAERVTAGGVTVVLGGLAMALALGAGAARDARQARRAQQSSARSRAIVRASAPVVAPIATAQHTTAVHTPVDGEPRWEPLAVYEVPQRGYGDGASGVSPEGRWAFLTHRASERAVFVDTTRGRALVLDAFAPELADVRAQPSVRLGRERVADEADEVDVETRTPPFIGHERYTYAPSGAAALRIVDLETARATVLPMDPPSGVHANEARDRLAWMCGGLGAQVLCSFDARRGTIARIALEPRSLALQSFVDEHTLAFMHGGAEGLAEPTTRDDAEPALLLVDVDTGHVDAFSIAGVGVRRVERSPDGRYVALALHPSGLAVLRVLDRRVVARAVESPLEWRFSPRGDALAWTESSSADAPVIDGSEVASRTVLHVEWLDAGQSVRRPGDAVCLLDSERFTSFDGAEVQTELACSPGCATMAYEPTVRVYRASDLEFVRRFAGASSPSSVASSARRAREARAVLRRVQRDPSAVVYFDPSEQGLVVATPLAVTFVPPGDEAVRRFATGGEGARWVLKSDPRGVLWLGVDDAGVAALWRASDGALVFRSQPFERGC